MMARAEVIPKLAGWHGQAALHTFYVCDVFTSAPLQGNQLGVFVDGQPFEPGEMQRLARELNFAETVFLFPPRNEGHVRMRIFTPRAELPFAGHPVLGTAFVVGAALGAERVLLETGAGVIPVELERNGGQIVFGWMRQPVPTWAPFEPEREVLAALGVESSLLPVEQYLNGPGHVYVELPGEAAVAALRPDMGAIADLEVPVNCYAGAGLRWKTRMFYPAAGVPEDAATGSAAGPLAVHLARHGRIGFGEQIEIRQGEELGRPSLLYARASGAGDRIDTVDVGGAAVLVAEGQYRTTLGVPG
jgi:trans-2,3-dihydro-3-hydroxyanthranilate isomerase